MIFKKYISAFLLFALFQVISAQSTTQIKRVLFVGNSYTGSNDLPNLTRTLAMSYGDTFEVFDRAPGGFTFSNHCASPDFFDQIRNGNFDAVILQEQSQLPSFPIEQVESQCFPYAKQIVDSIRSVNPKTRIVFYSTWGRQNGDQQNCASWPPVCSFKGMNELLRQRYIQMAKDNSCRVAPVSSVWRDLRDSTQLSLYEPDGSHPSITGSFVIAGVIYSTLFDKPLSTGKFAPFVSTEENMQIINTTNSIIVDSAFLWNYEYQLNIEQPTHFNTTKNNGTQLIQIPHNLVYVGDILQSNMNQFVIINSLGQIKTQNLTPNNRRELEINTENLESGLYFIVPLTNSGLLFPFKRPIWIINN